MKETLSFNCTNSSLFPKWKWDRFIVLMAVLDDRKRHLDQQVNKKSTCSAVCLTAELSQHNKVCVSVCVRESVSHCSLLLESERVQQISPIMSVSHILPFSDV